MNQEAVSCDSCINSACKVHLLRHGMQSGISSAAYKSAIQQAQMFVMLACNPNTLQGTKTLFFSCHVQA